MVQLGVTRVGQDHRVRVGHEEVVEQEEAVGLAEVAGGDVGDVEEAVAAAAVGVGGQLEQQAGHQVDGTAHLRELEQVQRHAVIVLDPVQAHPRHGVVAGHVVRVVRLVLVPEEG